MSISVRETGLAGVLEIQPQMHGDERGSFCEVWNADDFARHGIRTQFVQDNHSVSRQRWVMRGLHYQLRPYAQAKLVRVVRGSIFDVAADIHPASPTFGRWVGCTLDSEQRTLFWIPEGFAHGYVVLSETADVAYKVTAEYAAHLDRGVLWSDPAIGIDWPVRDPIVSEKDRAQPTLDAVEKAFR